MRSASGRVLEVGDFSVPGGRYRHVSYLALVGSPAENLLRRQGVLARSVPAVETAQAPGGRLPFPTGAFDVVVCTFAQSSGECRADEVARVLRPTGHLVFLERESPDLVPGPMASLALAGLAVRWVALSASPPGLLVRGVAVHPAVQYERELHWLTGGTAFTGQPVHE